MMSKRDTVLSCAPVLVHLQQEAGEWGAAVLNPNIWILPEYLSGLNILFEALGFQALVSQAIYCDD